MHNAINHTLAVSFATSLTLILGACGGMNIKNQSLYSTHQPIIERSHFVLDVNTNADGLPMFERQRLANWLESIGLRYGDHIAIKNMNNSPALREDIEALTGPYGVILSEGKFAINEYSIPDQARIVITRSGATVPNCPDWSQNAEFNASNATHSNYGCATYSNLAAMVANPEDLINGQQAASEIIATTSTKAIKAYRDKEPTGKKGLTEVNTTQGGN